MPSNAVSAVPQVAFVLGQPRLPALMPRVDGFRRRALLQAGRLSGKRRRANRDLKAAARRCEAVEGRQHKVVQHRLEGDGRIVCQRIAQRQRAMCRQLGDEPVRQRLDRVVIILLDGFSRRTADRDDRALDRSIGLLARRLSHRRPALDSRDRRLRAPRPPAGRSRGRSTARPSASMLTKTPARAISAGS